MERLFNLGFHSTDIGLGTSCMWLSCPRMVCEILCDVVLVLHLVDKTHGHTEPTGHILDLVASIDVHSNCFAEGLHDGTVSLVFLHRELPRVANKCSFVTEPS